jgi:hypothetical protein
MTALTQEDLQRLKDQSERLMLLAEGYIKTLPADKQEEMRDAVFGVQEEVNKVIRGE